MNSDALNVAMNESDLVICRAGYSSIMDLAKIQKKAILIPTPGQTEQIYLAKQLSNQKQAVVRDQDNLDLLSAISEVENIDGIQLDFDNQNLEKVLHEFIEQ
jgi:UDP-N-acetylglucosamine:LPS N-acetylglucosamine transferase